MNSRRFYKLLSIYAARGLALMNTESADETLNFVLSLQQEDGGFADRSGRSDLYYSLFAHLILKNTDKRTYRTELKLYLQSCANKPGWPLVEQACLLILATDLKLPLRKRIRLFFRLFSGMRRSIYEGEISYKYFMLLLAVDAVGMNNRLTRMMARYFYAPDGIHPDLPCSVVAAQLVLKEKLGLNVVAERKLLLTYFQEGKGFAAFPALKHADLLSTAVALVALNLGKQSLKTLAPACLQLAEHQFDTGAFLSGDGDQTRDAEYTFYGLLILGILST